MKSKYPKWIGVEDSSFMCIDEDDSIPSKVLYDANTGYIIFIYFHTEGCGCFGYDWSEYIIDELIDLCLNRNADIFSFSELETILTQKLRNEKLNGILKNPM